MVRSLVITTAVAGILAGAVARAAEEPPAVEASAQPLPTVKGDSSRTPNAANVQVIATFPKAMPTGVTVTPDNRVFLSFPRWTDPVDATVVEWKDGKAVPYPTAEMNKPDEQNPEHSLISVQSVVADGHGRVWLLDTGNFNMGKNLPHAPKLVGVDLKSDTVVKTIGFPADVVLPTTYLNDVRFDFTHGSEGTAYITDSAGKGDNGIIVVDIASGESWRRLNGEPSVTADAHFVPTVEGEPLEVREAGKAPQPLTIGADSIALSPDGQKLYFRPLASHHLYMVPTSLLVDRTAEVEQVSDGVKDLGDLGFASDGILFGKDGQLYLTDYEHHAIRRGDPTRSPATFEVFLSDPRLIWPDTLAISGAGHLYITVNQLDRGGRFHEGKDLREPPYGVVRVGE